MISSVPPRHQTCRAEYPKQPTFRKSPLSRLKLNSSVRSAHLSARNLQDCPNYNIRHPGISHIKPQPQAPPSKDILKNRTHQNRIYIPGTFPHYPASSTSVTPHTSPHDISQRAVSNSLPPSHTAAPLRSIALRISHTPPETACPPATQIRCGSVSRAEHKRPSPTRNKSVPERRAVSSYSLETAPGKPCADSHSAQRCDESAVLRSAACGRSSPSATPITIHTVTVLRQQGLLSRVP